MKRLSVCAALAACLTATPALAHFQMIIPSDDMVVQGESKNLTLDLRFWHPLEGHGMPMARPLRVGVLARGKKTDLAHRTAIGERKNGLRPMIEADPLEPLRNFVQRLLP